MLIKRLDGVFVTCPLGLGDLIVCTGMFIELAKKHKFCIVPVKKSNELSLKSLLGHTSNIYITSFKDSLSIALMQRQSRIVKSLGLKTIELGYFGKNWLGNTKKKFDEQMYNQAEVDFSYRWINFHPMRDNKKEMEFFDSFGVEKGKYAFIHEDKTRGMVIDRSLIDSSLTILESNPKYVKNSITDYMYLIENAAEIHTIESSFAALVESMNISNPKFAHRYARLKVVLDPRVEFTYKSDWVILN